MLRTYGDVFLVFAAVGLLRLVLPAPYVTHVVLFSIYTMGFSFLLGRLGRVSFGQPAYLGIGAYATGIYLHYFGTNPYAGLLVGVAVGVLFSLTIGALFVRLSSDYFALANLALCTICFFLFQKALVGVTRGDTGLWYLARISRTAVLDLRNPDHVFIVTLLTAVAVWVLVKYIDGTVYGAACLAVKSNERKLEFLGYSTFRVKWAGFILANTFAALSGSLYAVYLGFVSPAMVDPVRAAEVVVVGLLGGVGSVYGPLLGSLLYIAMQDLLSAVVVYWELFVGVLLVLVMLGGEKGLAATLEPLARKGMGLLFGRRQSAGNGEVDPGRRTGQSGEGV